MRLPCGFLNHGRSQRDRPKQTASTGGRGRIRTFVARKERQIYSLLVLATHPPVPRKQKDVNCLSPKTFQANPRAANSLENGNTKRTRVKRHQPVYFPCKDLLRLTPLPILGGAGGGN